MRCVATVFLWAHSVSSLLTAPATQLKTEQDTWRADAVAAVEEVIQASSGGDISLIVITEKSSSGEVATLLGASRGATVFQATPNSSRLAQVVARARQVRWASWMVVVVVVSDDPAFLAAFARQSREGRLLVWATRLMVVTRRAPPRLHPLHQTLALTNSLLLVPDVTENVQRVAAWVVLPYRPSGVTQLRGATWAVGRDLDLHRPLFFDKFSKFSGDTNLLVAMEVNNRHSVVILRDPTAPGGKRVIIKGFMVTALDYLAQGLNFSYTFQLPRDRSWGGKMQDGSFSGMLGQVQREEVDLGLGPFSIDAERYEAVDFTWPVTFVIGKVFAGRGSPEVDPWGFLHPLSTTVWAALLASLVLFSLTSFFISPELLYGQSSRESLARSAILRQGVQEGSAGWWRERVVLGTWMIMTFVLERSYESNLTSLLAVRHLSQPYQSLRDVLDDPQVGTVWHKDTALHQAFMDATAGIFFEVKASERRGRLMVLPVFKFGDILEEVRKQRKVIIDYDIIVTAIRSERFSQTGRCDFYIGHEDILSYPSVLISHKDSPLIPALNERIMYMTEAGLYSYWNNKGIPNSSRCEVVPTKITVSSPLSLRQFWAMLVVLAGGLAVGVAALLLERVLTQDLGH